MSRSSSHECKYWKTFVHRRKWRYCKTCNRRQYLDSGKWRDEIKIKGFAEKWLPATSGTKVEEMMTISAGFPFEWNCHESWNSVFKARFNFESRCGGTSMDIFNGWESKWHEDLNSLDNEMEQYLKEKTGREYQIGDNCYKEMRAAIQA